MFSYKRGPSSISSGMDYTAPAGVALEAGSGQPHQRRRPPLHRRIASDSDHLCTSSDNDLRSKRLASSGDRFGTCATAKRSSPPSSYGGRQRGIKAKELELRRQVALTVSPAEATTSAVGSLTSGDDHLSTDDSGHLCTSAVPADGGRPSAREEVFALVLTAGVKTRPSKNAATAPWRTTSCTTPRGGQRRERSRRCGRPVHGATVARVVDGQPRPVQAAGGSAGGGTKAT
jgi:hypothetical protein